ncbi:site-specific integrase [Bacteroides acidifaciens]|uniref:site-specific integrase n=1 Tax=Bacteroides acidifaciens TaxID=85831 RepID=UPI002493469F|nr:site-specific integrase [Bacteroides acidifaciens]
MKPTDFGSNLTNYLTVFLPGQRGISKNTIKSYADTFRLFFIYYHDVLGKRPERLTIANFNNELICGFLEWLEENRHNSIATRNQRLSALQAFCRYLLIEAPEYISLLQINLQIPRKKYTKPQIGYLSHEEMTEMLRKPDVNTLAGRRDLALLVLLYDSGARVSELTDLKVRDLHLEECPIVKLHGKGGKIRQVPLTKKTATILSKYLQEHHLTSPDKYDFNVFVNKQNRPLTRAGVTYILQKYTGDEKITPHVIRHTKAMHLLQAGINIIYIRDIMGHSSIDTTNIYARADTEMKRKALEVLSSDIAPNVPDWRNDTALMDWLKNISS